MLGEGGGGMGREKEEGGIQLTNQTCAKEGEGYSLPPKHPYRPEVQS